MRIHIHRALADTQHLVVMEVVLLHTTFLEGDSVQLRRAQAHDCSALDLRPATLGIDHEPAVDRRIHARNRYVALVVHRNFHNCCYIGQEAALYRDAQTMALWQLTSPAGFLGGALHDAARTGRVDRIRIPGIAVVPQLAGHGLARIDDARRADHLEQEVLGILPSFGGQFPHHALHGELVRTLVARPEPADAGLRTGLTGFQAQAGYVEL